MKYKNMKVPEWAYNEVHKARREILLRGTSTLPDELFEPLPDRNKPLTIGDTIGLAASLLNILMQPNSYERTGKTF